MDTHDHSYEENDELIISHESMGFLKETGGWGQMLAIIGFVFIGLMVLSGFFMGAIMSELWGDVMPFSGSIIGVIYIVMAVIYFFPVLYLYKFSTQVKSAILGRDNALLDVAFENLKSHYKIIGILTIVVLGFYILGGIGLVLFGMAF